MYHFPSTRRKAVYYPTFLPKAFGLVFRFFNFSKQTHRLYSYFASEQLQVYIPAQSKIPDAFLAQKVASYRQDCKMIRDEWDISTLPLLDIALAPATTLTITEEGRFITYQQLRYAHIMLHNIQTILREAKPGDRV